MKTRISDSRAQGFTLLEITVVLFIIGLMIAGLFGPLETQLEARDRRQTQDALQQILDALYGYALTHGRLPCPDKDGDGHPDPIFDATNAATKAATATCEELVGLLPWSELAVAQVDAWGNRFTYAVTKPHFTLPDTDGLCNGNAGTESHFDLCTTGNLIVRSRGDDSASPGLESKAILATYADKLPAVVVSHGRNGLGAQTSNGVNLPDPPAGTDELENADDDAIFMSRIYSRGSGSCTDDPTETTPLCEYDDLVVWLAPTILNGRMVSAGRLP